ncbi:hypothetical protein [Bacillus phage SBSphiJ5]|nr:hypothetical protein [Bacillus phage SBSphiJ5]
MSEQTKFEVTVTFKEKSFVLDEEIIRYLKEKFYFKGPIGLVYGEDTLLRDTRTGEEVTCSAAELWNLLMSAEGKLRELKKEYHEERRRRLNEYCKELEEAKQIREKEQELRLFVERRVRELGFRDPLYVYENEKYIQYKGKKRRWFREKIHTITFQKLPVAQSNRLGILLHSIEGV